MVQYLQYLVFAGAAAQLFGIISYAKETLKGNTKPNRVTWLLWSIAPLIAAFAALSDGIGLSVVPVFMSGIAPSIVFFASFANKRSYWKLGKFDYLCGLCSALALILWAITKQPVVAIVFSIMSDGLAGLPTLIKAWKYPETETIHAYIGGLFGSLTSFFAIKAWSFAGAAFPVYLATLNSLLIISICRKKIIGPFAGRR